MIPDKYPKNFNTLHPAYPYQKTTIIHGICNRNVGLFLDMGQGKTFCSINIARFRLLRGQAKKVLVVCPASILYNWERQIEKFSEFEANVLHSPYREERKWLFKKKSDFYLINYEGLQPYFDEVMELSPDIVIFDESAKYIKNFRTNRSLASTVIADTAKYKMLLTGTPISKRPIDIWSQYRALDGGRTFGKDFYKWRWFFFYKIERGGYSIWVLKPNRIAYLRKLIYKTAIRFRKRDVLPDLPPETYEVVHVELPPTSRADYHSLQSQIINEIEIENRGKERVNITNIFTKLIRLQQYTSGFIKGESRTEHALPVQPKLDALIEYVESVVDSNESIVIWCKFLESIRLIENRLIKKKIKCITMTGKDSASEKDKKWRSYQINNTPVFIGQIEAGGIGTELFKEGAETNKTQYMCFYDNPWTIDSRNQAKDRILRIGQNASCHYVDFVVKDSIDVKVLQTLSSDQEIADSIIEKGVKGFLYDN